mmetsp:Transcript_67181/g.125555  ORF Transcript_67181/g.125555 Transcript_67181/m.125555 type:complete len:233 (-) Transcript_67181:752-1450(-)
MVVVIFIITFVIRVVVIVSALVVNLGLVSISFVPYAAPLNTHVFVVGVICLLGIKRSAHGLTRAPTCRQTSSGRGPTLARLVRRKRFLYDSCSATATTFLARRLLTHRRQRRRASRPADKGPTAATCGGANNDIGTIVVSVAKQHLVGSTAVGVVIIALLFGCVTRAPQWVPVIEPAVPVLVAGHHKRFPVLAVGRELSPLGTLFALRPVDRGRERGGVDLEPELKRFRHDF